MSDETAGVKTRDDLSADLARLMAGGEGVLFFGDDFGPLPTGDNPPGRAAFAARLAARLMTDELDTRASAWEIAEAYQAQYGRHSLISELQDWIEEAGAKPYPIHRAIARLPLEAIITTCTDDRLEQALIAAGKTPVKVVTDLDVPFVGADKVLVLKLFVNLAPKVQASFLAGLAQCVRELPRQVRFVLALREDFLPQLEA